MSTKRTVLGLLGVGLLGTALTAGMCATPATDCTAEGDCSTEEHCHPTLKQCVPNCKKTGTCADDPGTTCSETDIITPVNAMSFNGICVCDPASDQCSGGDKCNPTDRVCDTPCTGDTDCSVYPSDQNRTCQDSGGTKFCLPPADSCIGKAADFCGTQVCNTISGSTNYAKCIDKCPAVACTGTTICDASGLCITPCTAGTCGAGKYCDDVRFGNTGACLTQPTSCDTYDNCLTATEPMIGICDPTAANETYNLCADPDSVTDTCDGVGVFTTALADGGPIIYDVAFEADAANDSLCTAITAGTHTHWISFSYYDFEGNAYSSQTTASYAAITWARSGGSAQPGSDENTFTDMAGTGAATGTEGIVVMMVCFQTAPTEIAVQISDSGAHKSNVGCATLQ